mgnify:CR=1 FL=1
MKSLYGAVLLTVCALLSTGGPVQAQPQPYRVAVLTPGLTFRPALEGLREGLAQFGQHEGKELAIIIEDTQGELTNLTRKVVQLVEIKPDVIVAIGSAAAIAAKQGTTELPIVFTFVADPLRSGLIASYASSQNNMTGISSYAGPLSGKRLEILKETVPGIKRVLVLVAAQEHVSVSSFQSLTEVASKLGIELLRHAVGSRQDIEQMLGSLHDNAVDAILHVPSSLVGTHIDLLIRKAKEERIPLGVPEHSMVERGALMSYGSDMRLLGKQTAHLVIKILQGVRPAELRVQTPGVLVLTVNLTTARVIGLDIPLDIIERAERIVE